MTTAKRLSCLFSVLIPILAVSLPATAQRGLPDPTRLGSRARPAWTAGSAGIPSAEYRSPSPDARPIYESGIGTAPPRSQPVPGTVSIARLKNAPPPKAVKEMEKGVKALAEGRRDEAIEHYERAIEIHPTYIEAYNNLGVQNLKLGRVDAAIAALEKAVELDPASAEPHLNLSVALHSAGQLDAALYQAERAIELAPHSPSANLGLGLVLMAKGQDLEQAVRRLQFASSEHPGASIAAADALLQLDRPKEAQAALRAFLGRGPATVK